MNMKRMTQRLSVRIFIGLLVVCLFVHVATLWLGVTFFKEWRLLSEPVHSSIEIAGAIIAFFVAHILLHLDVKKIGIFNGRWVASALICMGVLDGLHAFTSAGQSFVLLHSFATFFGGLLFVAIWLPENYLKSKIGQRWPIIVGMFSLVFGVFSLIFSDYFPPMLSQDGLFTPTARLLNIIGGVLFIVASVKLVVDYKKSADMDSLLFFLHCILFGGAAIMFEQSKLWDFTWWGWHILRLVAYVVALYYVVRSFSVEAEEEIQKFARFPALNPGIIFELSSSGLVKLSNPSAKGLLKQLNVKSTDWSTIVSSDTKKFLKDILHSDGFAQREVVLKGKDWLLSYRGVKAVDSIFVYGVDISLQNRLKKEKLHSAKLASIGELAAGVGHEINNPLAMAMGNLVSLKEKELSGYADTKSKVLDIKKVEMAHERILKIVDGLRTYARADIDSPEVVSLSIAVSKTINLISEIYKKDSISIVVEQPEQELFTKGSLGKLQQIIMNLVSNARDATEGVKDRKIHLQLLSGSDETVVFSVGDNGVGIPAELMDKIVTPFFTTKPEGKGTGMGLGLVNELVKEMGGRLEIESKVGKGSKFTIILPSVQGGVGENILNHKEELGSLSGVALVVDDEEGIREILADYLVDMGLDVEEADSGVTALEKVRGKKYDYICTDMKMPGMCGDEFMTEAKKLPYGDTDYLIITGGVTTKYADAKAVSLFAAKDNYIDKPFTKASVYRALFDIKNRRTLEG